ncbi:MAG: cellulase family glycosylhydrolase, partial [Pyrinomonadaceae bacterium]
MGKHRVVVLAAFACVVGAAIFFSACTRGQRESASREFVKTSGAHFITQGRRFRFVGANVAVMYRDEDRARMPETLRAAALSGISVLRVWASGEGGPEDIKPIGDFRDWPRTHPFRWKPGEWNEEAFVHLDHVIAEAARNNLRVQLTLANWWRDTGGVTQYLRWVGINDAANDRAPYGIDEERAMLFYTNEETRRLYREHVQKIVARRNTVTGLLYRDDPTIMGYELINEGKAAPGRLQERREWVALMSAYIKSLDPKHLVTPGIWGYRNAVERREWLKEHELPNIDFCDVHNYPKDDSDSFVDSPAALREFIDNRVAASISIGKPLVFGEFGIGPEGYKGFSQAQWFHSYFESTAQRGANGAMFWILTPDVSRGYGITYTDARDMGTLEEIKRGSQLFASLQDANQPRELFESGHHLIPRQFAFTRQPNDPATRPEIKWNPDSTILYRFKPEAASSARFEKLGGDAGYIWGAGVGFLEYTMPARERWKRVGNLVVRAHIQPVVPDDAHGRIKTTRVTLLINGTDCGSRLIPLEEKGQVVTQEWRVDSLAQRLRAARGLPLSIRFTVKVDADQPYGVNISNWPEGYEAHDAAPVEVEV